MLEYILNLLYPDVCGFCNDISKNSLCKKCELKLKKYEINNIDMVSVKNQHFDKLINMLKYEGEVRRKVIEYKFGGESYLYKTFAKIILKNKKICGILENYDIIIPVPLHRNKKCERGYNQTELVARELSKKIFNLELRRLLIKTKNTDVQSLLTKKQRKENVKNAFEVTNKERIKNNKIILFDDIYTTGSTANECSRILKQLGAKDILVLTIAKD